MKNDISEYLGSVFNDHIVNLDSIALGEVLHAPKANLANRFDSFKMGNMDQISFQFADNQSNDTYFSYRKRGSKGEPKQDSSLNNLQKVIHMNRFRPKLKNTTSLNFDKGISHMIGREQPQKSLFSKSIQSGMPKFKQMSISDSDYENVLSGKKGSQTFDFYKINKMERVSIEDSNLRLNSEKMERVSFDLKSDSSLHLKSKTTLNNETNEEGQETRNEPLHLTKIVQFNFQQIMETATSNLRIPGILSERRKTSFKEEEPMFTISKPKMETFTNKHIIKTNKKELEVIKEMSQVVDESKYFGKTSGKSSFCFFGNSEMEAAPLDASVNAILDSYYNKLQKELFYKIYTDPFTQGSLNNSDKLIWNSELVISDLIGASGKNPKFMRFSENKETIGKAKSKEQLQNNKPDGIFYSHQQTPRALKSPINSGTHSKFDLKNPVLESELISNEQFSRNKNSTETGNNQSNLELGPKPNNSRNTKHAFEPENWHATVKHIKSNEIRKTDNDLLSEKSMHGFRNPVEISSETVRFNEKNFTRKTRDPRDPKVVHYMKYEPVSNDFPADPMQKSVDDSSKLSHFQNGGFKLHEMQFSRETNKIGKGKWSKLDSRETIKKQKREKREIIRVEIEGQAKFNSLPRNDLGTFSGLKQGVLNENDSHFFSLNPSVVKKINQENPENKNKKYLIGYWKNHPLLIDKKSISKSPKNYPKEAKKVVKFINVCNAPNRELNFDSIQLDNRNLKVNIRQSGDYIFQTKNQSKEDELRRLLSTEKSEGYLGRYLQFGANNKEWVTPKHEKQVQRKRKFRGSPDRKFRKTRGHSRVQISGQSKLYKNVNQKDFIRENKKMVRELSKSRRKLRKKNKSQNDADFRKRSILSYQMFKDQNKRYKELYLNKKKQKLVVKQSLKIPKSKPEFVKNKKPGNEKIFKYKQKIYLNEIDRISGNIDKFHSLSKKLKEKRKK